MVDPTLSYSVKSVLGLNFSEVCEINWFVIIVVDKTRILPISTKLSFELFLADFNLLEYKFFGKSLDHLKLDKN